MTGQREKKDVRELRFTCPECGGHRLLWEDLTAYFRSAIIESIDLDEDGDSDYVRYGLYKGQEPEFRRSNHSIGLEWRCHDCGYELLNDEGELVGDEQEVLEWFLGNCDQA